MDQEVLKDRFKGCLLGSFVGDALGMPVEGFWHEEIRRKYGEVKEMLEARLGKGRYTDDTEMMIGLAESLFACKGFNGEDMAQRFLENYHEERGYGAGTKKALSLIKSGASWDEAAGLVFNGGSFGNGAAMRIAPVAVFYYDQPQMLRKVADKSSQITHAHPLAKEGAALQAYAIALALQNEGEIQVNSFIKDLIEFTRQKEYKEALEKIIVLLEKDISRLPFEGMEERIQQQAEIIVHSLGHDSRALYSVPTAIYCFLRHPRSFEQTLIYAVSLGGDTDTIAAMSGAISGAYHGNRAIPQEWLRDLENGEKGRQYVEELALKLWKIKTEKA